MSNRIAEVVVLCEDPLHFTFVNAYLGQWPIATGKITKNQGPLGLGAGKQHVVEKFPGELARLLRNAARRRAALIVIADADNESVEQLERRMLTKLDDGDLTPPREGEPIVLLIPKWSLDTWIEYFRSQLSVSEDISYKPRPGKAVDRKIVHRAASALYRMVSAKDAPPAPVPSMNLAIRRLREFQKVAKDPDGAR